MEQVSGGSIRVDKVKKTGSSSLGKLGITFFLQKQKRRKEEQRNKTFGFEMLKIVKSITLKALIISIWRLKYSFSRINSSCLLSTLCRTV